MKFTAISTLLLQCISLGYASDDSNARELYQQLSIYTPKSLIASTAGIDRDLHSIKLQLLAETSTGFKNGMRLYTEGAHAKSVAEMFFDLGTSTEIPSGAKVVGETSVAGTTTMGTVHNKVAIGGQVIQVEYDPTYELECLVGGHYDPDYRGCFNNTGTLEIEINGETKSFPYTYERHDNNLNFRSIRDLSRGLKGKMWDCPTCPTPEYKKFVEYFGQFDYSDHIISAAFDAVETQMKNGNMDFSLFGRSSRRQVIENAAAYMSVWMYVLHELDDAVEGCYAGCTDDSCSHAPGMHSWDRAVAFYTGSRNAREDTEGNLIYDLADSRCVSMKTCGHAGDSFEGTANVNHEVLRRFVNGQTNIENGDCDLAREKRDDISRLMLIPLLQGAIRFTHKFAYDSSYDAKHNAEAASFVLATLPFVHACNAEDAKIIYDNLKPTPEKSQADFEEVKAAYERNFKCMNVECGEVGGIYDLTTLDYKVGAEPVCNRAPRESSQANGGLIAGATIGGLALVFVGVVLFSQSRNQQEEIVHAVDESKSDSEATGQTGEGGVV